jgi:hypothetical protein
LPVLCFPPVFVHRVIVPFLDVLASSAHRVLPALPVLLLIGGLLHFGILIASALVPGVLDWRRELAKLEPMTRHLVWVHGVFIVLTIIGLGVIATLNAATLNSGTTIARTVCAFVAVFWGARLLIQVTLFDPSAFLTRPILSIGYQGLTIVFAYLAGVFGFAALRGLV